MKHLKAKEVGRFKDGGTLRVLAEDGHHYYIDHRKKTKTPGRVYNHLPSLLSSKLVPIHITVIPNEEFDKLMKKKSHEHDT